MLHLIWTILVGFLVGLLARFFYPGAISLGFLYTSLLGIAGSFVGGAVARLFSRPAAGTPFHPAGILMSIVGAMLLIWICLHFNLIRS